MALSSEVTYSAGVEAAEELAASAEGFAGATGGAGNEVGVLEAKRTPAPFRIKTFSLENCDLVYGLGIGAVFLERSGLARIDPYCTVEENLQSQHWPRCPGVETYLSK